jgi:hypothetical protein
LYSGKRGAEGRTTTAQIAASQNFSGHEQMVKMSRLVMSGQNYLSHERLVNIIQATNNWSKLFRPVKSGQRLFKII